MSDAERREDPSGSGSSGAPSMAGGWADAMGLEFVSMTQDEVVIEWTVDARHLQPFGIVHGGVYAGVVETACSVGAALNAAPLGQNVVGVENHTSFLRATRGGRLRCVARPLQRGRRAHLWEANIHDTAGKLIATGRVRLFCIGQDEARGEGRH